MSTPKPKDIPPGAPTSYREAVLRPLAQGRANEGRPPAKDKQIVHHHHYIHDMRPSTRKQHNANNMLPSTSTGQWDDLSLGALAAYCNECVRQRPAEWTQKTDEDEGVGPSGGEIGVKHIVHHHYIHSVPRLREYELDDLRDVPKQMPPGAPTSYREAVARLQAQSKAKAGGSAEEGQHVQTTSDPKHGAQPRRKARYIGNNPLYRVRVPTDAEREEQRLREKREWKELVERAKEEGRRRGVERARRWKAWFEEIEDEGRRMKEEANGCGCVVM